MSGNPSAFYLSSCLVSKGYSLNLQKRYRNSDWLNIIGIGAMIRSGHDVGYENAINAFQQQSGLFIHPSGKTALSLLGKLHYLELSQKK
ncbi:transcriptional regulator with AbiEi antitoxin N-terminal domain [Pricia antarctica]|uniref:Transcriptional regulator with AbiEi antitoxin N-terminal domain n=1 Tax=Pricia antarctica TaxID=641691 RepID=A0A1G7CAQ1_9FLAO|nr:transcriptional regulator with AbiEi antitoxin N-terminal domain [Pricia antarctica]